MAKGTKRWLTLAVIVGVVVVGGLIYRSNKANTSYETETIDRGTVVERVSVTGSIAPKTRVNLQAEASARVTEIAVEAGDKVEEGDLLLRQDSSDLSARIAGARASVAAAQALLDQYRAGATAEEIQVAAAALASAKANYQAALTAQVDAEKALANAKSKAEVNLDNQVDAMVQAYDKALTTASDAMNRLSAPLYTTGDEQLTFVSSDAVSQQNAINTRRTARTALMDLESKVNLAKAVRTVAVINSSHAGILADLQAIKSNMDASAAVLTYAVLSDSVKESYKTSVSVARSGLNADIQAVSSAKSTLDLQQNLNEGAIDAAETALNNATSNAEAARLAVDQSQASYDLKVAGTRTEQVAAQRAQVQAAQATLSQLYSDLGKRRIEAPIDGVVTEVMVEKGESLLAGASAVMMQAEGKFEIVANISEVDIASIDVGNPVEITLDAFPSDQVWSGTIVSVWPAEKVVEGVIFYETKILFDEEDERLKSGMTANLEIETGRAEDVLRLPLRALREQDGQRYVLVLNSTNEAVEQEIETGLENSEYLEITSGLSVGDEVVVGENND